MGPDALWIMACETIVSLFIIFFFVTEIKKLRQVGTLVTWIVRTGFTVL